MPRMRVKQGSRALRALVPLELDLSPPQGSSPAPGMTSRPGAPALSWSSTFPAAHPSFLLQTPFPDWLLLPCCFPIPPLCGALGHLGRGKGLPAGPWGIGLPGCRNHQFKVLQRGSQSPRSVAEAGPTPPPAITLAKTCCAPKSPWRLAAPSSKGAGWLPALDSASLLPGTPSVLAAAPSAISAPRPPDGPFCASQGGGVGVAECHHTPVPLAWPFCPDPRGHPDGKSALATSSLNVPEALWARERLPPPPEGSLPSSSPGLGWNAPEREQIADPGGCPPVYPQNEYIGQRRAGAVPPTRSWLPVPLPQRRLGCGHAAHCLPPPPAQKGPRCVCRTALLQLSVVATRGLAHLIATTETALSRAHTYTRACT